MNRVIWKGALALGLLVVLWVGSGFVGTSWLALAMTVAIGAVYLFGAMELRRFRAATDTLSGALADVTEPLADLNPWLQKLHPSLQTSVRLRIEGERVALPGPALTPYLVGLLVMLGMLGTFLGMVVTFKGAVFALEGSSDLQAIRAALAEPIKGLGLSFGTSVAGVATSAMLGLISAMSRRDRIAAARQLDGHIATVFKGFSLVHQRQETFKALQAQSQALPAVVDKLQAMMDGLERRSEQLGSQLQNQQQQFHSDVSQAYGELARSVQQSLRDTLVATAREASQSIQPALESALSRIEQASQQTHQRVVEVAQGQLSDLSSQFAATASNVSQAWSHAVQTHTEASGQQLSRMDHALQSFAEVFEQRSAALLLSIQESSQAAREAQLLSEGQRQQAWTQALQDMSASLVGEWQRVGTETMAQQQALCLQLENTAGQITEQASAHVGQTLGELGRVMDQSESMLRARMEAESAWVQSQGERMAELSAVWRTELAALRDEEAARGQAAVARLDALQEAVAGHLAQLGASLEAPMNRLLQTASEVPQAAAQVIAQLRQEMSHLAERDNLALQERSDMMVQMNALLQTLNQAADQQQAMIESMVSSAAAALDKVGSQLSESLGDQVGKVAQVAAHQQTMTESMVSQAAATLDKVSAQMSQSLGEQASKVTQAAEHQQTMIESMVSSAVAVLGQAGTQLSESLSSQAGKVADVAAHVNASAIELSSLSEAFGHGVDRFSATNEKLIDSLHRIEGSLQQSLTRSDEQLAYYVAQAREVIDLSISSQQGIVEDLRRLHAREGQADGGAA